MVRAAVATIATKLTVLILGYWGSEILLSLMDADFLLLFNLGKKKRIGGFAKKKVENRMDLSILVVNYNRRVYLKKCLETIYAKTKGICFEIIVVDNGSADGSVEVIEGFQRRFGNLKFIRNEKNEYFAKPNNQAYAISTGDFIVTLNNDVELVDDVFTILLKSIKENHEIGGVAPRFLNPDGSFQRLYRRFPTVLSIICASTYFGRIIKRLPFGKRAYRRYMYLDESFDRIMPVEQPGATCLMLSRETIETVGGLFDERFELLFNDTDLCKRIWNYSKKIMFIPEAKIVHYGSVSSELLGDKVYMDHRYHGILEYFRKYHSWRDVLLLEVILNLNKLIRVLMQSYALNILKKQLKYLLRC